MKATNVERSRVEVNTLGNIRNPKKTDADIIELAASIKEVGLLEPPVVWHRRVRGDKDRYILTIGFRRWCALELACEQWPDVREAYERVHVMLLEGNEADAKTAQLVENLHRKDLSPSECAEGVHALRVLGMSQEQIAHKLKRSQSWVSRVLQFRDGAQPELKEAVKKGLGMDVAFDLITKPADVRAKALEGWEAARKAGGGKRSANKAARAATGRSPMRARTMVEAQYESLQKAHAAYSKRGKGAPRELALAINVLGWVLGDNAWPHVDGQPLPPHMDIPPYKG